jgi:hypothetical protein
MLIAYNTITAKNNSVRRWIYSKTDSDIDTVQNPKYVSLHVIVHEGCATEPRIQSIGERRGR